MLVQKSFYNLFLGYLVKKGNKIHAKRIIDSSFLELVKRFKQPLHLLLRRVLRRMGNLLEIKTVKKRKGTLVIPFAVGYKRRNYLLVKRIMDSIKEDNSKKSFKDKLVDELAGIILKDKYSKSIQKNKTITKQAILNRANTHFRW